MNQQLFDRQVRFPRISTKSKSVPSSIKRIQSSLEAVSAKSWLYCSPTQQYGVKSNMKRQIASLTKIMTALVSLQICQRFNMALKTTYFKVTGWTTSTIGTSAQLLQNAWISVEDLLYGMMLPSGNDAASVLAENIGAVLYFQKTGNKSLIQGNLLSIQSEIRSIDLTEDYESVRLYTQEFVYYMNNRAKEMRMTKTRFANPHGLDHINNYSTCEDMLILCRQALMVPFFRKVASAVTYRGTFKFYKQGKVVSKYIVWSNTNKLLQKSNVFGIKTGITNKAGGCLATSLVQTDKQQAIIIVLGSSSSETRFLDTLKIMNYICDDELLSSN